MKKMAPNHRLPWSLPVDRDFFIMRQSRGRRVLHLACASAPFTRELHESNQLLHQKLSRCALDICGVDVEREALAYLESEGYQQLIGANLLDAEEVARVKTVLPWTPEVVLAGELLEHLDQQGIALKNIASLLGPRSKLVITVPNSFSLKAFVRVCIGHEKVSHDHVSYFSYANLKQLAARTGLRIEQIGWYTSSFPSRHPLERIFDYLTWPALMVRPQIADGIIAVCTLEASSDQSSAQSVTTMELDANITSDLRSLSQ